MGGGRKVLVGPVLAALVFSACSSGSPSSARSGSGPADTTTSTTTFAPTTTTIAPTTTTAPPVPTSTTTTTLPPVGPPPGVPAGAYLGAWISPAQAATASPAAGAQELAQLAAFRQRMGRGVAILPVYAPFRAAPPTATLNAISAQGAIPLLNWRCAPPAAITSGADDLTILGYARSLRAYGRPMFLRWFWGMNVPTGHPGCPIANPAAYVAAWHHIRDLFRTEGASNVAFVWSPGLSPGLASMVPYYPGDPDVDWIAVDAYDHATTKAGDFAETFGPWYAQWSPHGKPLMIAETGAAPASQATYLASAKTLLPTQFPAIKAFVYFDAPGPGGQWQLIGPGATAFADLGSDPYFVTSVP